MKISVDRDIIGIGSELSLINSDIIIKEGSDLNGYFVGYLKNIYFIFRTFPKDQVSNSRPFLLIKFIKEGDSEMLIPIFSKFMGHSPCFRFETVEHGQSKFFQYEWVSINDIDLRFSDLKRFSENGTILKLKRL